MPSAKPTLSDVAKAAGVSPKTVSRVVNREPYVSDEVRREVEKAIAALGYVPNRAARQLAGNRSSIIAMFFGNLNASYMTDLILSAAVSCRERGCHLVCEPVEIEDDTTRVFDHAIASLRPDGIILLPPYCDSPAVLARVEAAGIKAARIAGTRAGYGHSILLDEEPVSRALVSHLIAKGHRRIGMISPRRDQLAAEGRARGYRAALAEAGIAYDPAIVREGDFLFESGLEQGAALLDMAEPPSAIFATNDMMALGVMTAARARGLRLPEDLAIAGFDDTPQGRVISPPLTTVRQPLEAIAASAVAWLSGEDYARDGKDAGLRHELILRASTGD